MTEKNTMTYMYNAIKQKYMSKHNTSYFKACYANKFDAKTKILIF